MKEGSGPAGTAPFAFRARWQYEIVVYRTGALLLAALFCLSCSRSPEQTETPAAEPTPTEVVQSTPTPTPEPTPEPVNQDAVVSILGYHRFEDRVRDSLALSPEDLRKQMEAIRDAGLEVISMDDFLAWRRGEKSIPDQAVLITIDDGYDDTYSKAWPIFQEFGYPFAFFVYTDYIGVGGRSISWEELKEMAEAGVTIGSHSVSHANLAKRDGRSDEAYRAFLEKEMVDSKKLLEEKLGIDVKTFVYPYGINNEEVRKVGEEAGYEALFTVKGSKVHHDSPFAELGRYIIQSDHPEIFRMALNFSGKQGASAGNTMLAKVDLPFPVSPAPGEATGERNPIITIDLSGFESVDPKSIELRLSSLGEVKPTYDAATKTLTYQPRAQLRHSNYKISFEARADGKVLKESWSFALDPSIGPPPTAPSEYQMPDAPVAAADQVEA